ncbi:MAG: cytochrome c, partial [Rhodospirillales bacterium]|nr:cytochrome c [Rhodospirillales bacterium]
MSKEWGAGRRSSVSVLFAALLLAWPALGADDLYQRHCAACHGADRLGAMGPALLPESLARLKKTEAQLVIAQG